MSRTATSSVTFDSSATTIMSFNATSYRSAELYIQLSDSGNTEYACMKANVVHNGTTAFISTYGVVNSMGEANDMATITATHDGSATVNVQAVSSGGSTIALTHYSLAAV